MTYSKKINNKNIILINKQNNNDSEFNIQNWEPALWFSGANGKSSYTSQRVQNTWYQN